MVRRPTRWLALVVVIASACGGPVVPPTASPGASPAASLTATPGASPTPAPRHAHDGAIDKAGLRHDSRDTTYRTPGGAVPAGTSVLLRFRTFHDDATQVTARIYSVNDADDELLPMDLVASGVSCYDAAVTDDTCDFWQTTLANSAPDNIWYRFIVEDGDAKVYYADDTPALDGGEGGPSDVVIDQSFALMVYVPDFTTPDWAKSAVFYQIFPDRFRNGDPSNDPQTGDPRYDDPVIKKDWRDKPEGYCRGYSSGTCDEDPRGRDYFGGDLAGITQELDYLHELGVTAIYLNPILDSASNHGYDTQDWTKIDPYFGSATDWTNLVQQADAKGIRIILDGVFNHMSSDSPFFDRYGHYNTVGACESVDSEFRDWFYFRPQPGGGCAGPDGPNTIGYTGWSGIDSIPVIQKGLEAVRDFLLTTPDSITRRWLAAGSSGWRLDVPGDPTFPDDWWPTFRQVVKETSPDALTVSEQWQKDTTMLRQLRGDRFDTTMNYRFRDAVLGFLAPGLFDRKGFPASGAPTDPADFANRMLSQQEDYPPEVYRALLNLIDSHDTERALWTLTPGDETPADKEENAANVADGIKRLELATLIQFTMPGAPMIYYGDEVGLTGDDDPDDRRPYPWPDQGGSPDRDLAGSYHLLTYRRANDHALTDGDLRFLLTGDHDEGTIAYGRRTDDQVAIVAINRSSEARTLKVPVNGYLPDGAFLTGGNRGVAVDGGFLVLDVSPLSAVVLMTGDGDFAAPDAPAGVTAIRLDPGSPVQLLFDPVDGGDSYNYYGSPLSGGGYVRLITGDKHVPFMDSFLPQYRYFVVTAVDAAGNESSYSNEVDLAGPV
jgi:glycosidase